MKHIVERHILFSIGFRQELCPKGLYVRGKIHVYFTPETAGRGESFARK